MATKLKVYMARKNADMNEGRGPMVNDMCFQYRKHAEEYIDRQCGVMGRRPPSGKWSQEEYGDWDIAEIEVHSSVPADKDALRKHALSKLTHEERRVLDLE